MSAVDDLLNKPVEQKPTTLDVCNVIRQLATNKDVKAFITAMNKYSKKDWANIMETFRHAYHVFQSSLFVTNDSMLATEMRKYPYLQVFFSRIENE